MSFEIPEPYVWDESFKVFYDNLDDEHKGLFKGIFAVAAKPPDGNALSTLVTAVDDHFKYEEGEMQKNKYADYPSHKKIHDEFLGKLRGLKAPVDDKTVHFAKNWLVQHIKTIDFQYKGKLG
uniref:Hemerythrin n=1 Tax=Phascolosoma agassizii TaxID=360543 RepID=A0A1S6QD41_9ANNE|nr:hemerythrin [Phascolosoma agassizii]